MILMPSGLTQACEYSLRSALPSASSPKEQDVPFRRRDQIRCQPASPDEMDQFNNIHRFRRLEPRFTSVSAVGSASADKPTEAPASSRVQKGTALSSMSFFIIGFSSRLRVSLEKLSNASECYGGLAALSSLRRATARFCFRNVC